jgi:hypothetical protein
MYKNTGRIAWNKGLTKETDDRVLSYAKSLKGLSSQLKGTTFTAEHVSRISSSLQGHILSEDTKLKISKAHVGKVVSESHRKNLSDSISKAYIDGKYNNLSSTYTQGIIILPRLNQVVYYRSSYEKQALLLLDKDINVSSVSVEPLRIPYTTSEGVIRYYIPDLLVNFIDNATYLIEIKPERLVSQDLNQSKFIAGKEYADKHNMLFIILTEQELFNNSNSVTTTFSGVIQRATAATQLLLNKEKSDV